MTCYPFINGSRSGSGVLTTNNSNATTNVTTPYGPITIGVQCEDGTGNNNVSTRSYIAGVINISSPANNSIIHQGDSVYLNHTIVFGSEYFDNVTITIHYGDNATSLLTSNSTAALYNASFTVPTISPRYVNITSFAFKNSDGAASNISTFINLKLGRSNTTVAPAETFFCSNETYSRNNTNVTLRNLVNLDTLLEGLAVQVTRPGGSQTTLTPIQNMSDINGSINYDMGFNYTFLLNETGTYNITANVTDLESQTVNTTALVVSSANQTVNWSSSDITNITLNDVCTGLAVANGTTIQTSLPSSAVYNMTVQQPSKKVSLRFGNANITLQNISLLINSTIRTTETDPPSGQRRIGMVDIYPNFTFSLMNFSYNYSEINYTLTAPVNINLYYCSNLSDCDLAKVPAIVDTQNASVSPSSVSPGRFMVTEPALGGNPSQYDTPNITAFNISRAYGAENQVLNVTVAFTISSVLRGVNLTVDNTTFIQPYNITNTSTLDFIYRYNYTPSLGNHTLNLTVFDENTFNASESKMFYTVTPVAMTLNSSTGQPIELRDIYSSELITNGTTISSSLPPGRYDVVLKTARVTVTLVNSSVNASTSDVGTYTDISTEIEPASNRTSLFQFEVNSTLNYTHVSFVFNYSNLSYVEEENLEVYKCEDINSCNLSQVPVNIISNNGTLNLSVSNLSVFQVAEASITVTNTQTVTKTVETTTSNTQQVENTVSLELLPDLPSTVESGSTMSGTLNVINAGTVGFENIAVKMVSSDDIDITPSSIVIANLDPENKVAIPFKVSAGFTQGSYHIKAIATSENPKYEQPANILLRVIQSTTVIEKEKIIDRIQFAYDLFKEHPNCLEYQDIIKKAEEALSRGESQKARELVDSAIEACKDSVSSPETQSAAYIKEKLNVLQLVLAVLAITLGIWLAVEQFILKRRRGAFEIKSHGGPAQSSRVASETFSSFTKSPAPRSRKPRAAPRAKIPKGAQWSIPGVQQKRSKKGKA